MDYFQLYSAEYNPPQYDFFLSLVVYSKICTVNQFIEATLGYHNFWIKYLILTLHISRVNILEIILPESHEHSVPCSLTLVVNNNYWQLESNCLIWNKSYWFVFIIASQQHLMDMAATQTMPYEKLYAKGKEVTFEPDFYYGQVTTAEQISLGACISHLWQTRCHWGYLVIFSI